MTSVLDAAPLNVMDVLRGERSTPTPANASAAAGLRATLEDGIYDRLGARASRRADHRARVVTARGQPRFDPTAAPLAQAAGHLDHPGASAPERRRRQSMTSSPISRRVARRSWRERAHRSRRSTRRRRRGSPRDRRDGALGDAQALARAALESLAPAHVAARVPAARGWQRHPARRRSISWSAPPRAT